MRECWGWLDTIGSLEEQQSVLEVQNVRDVIDCGPNLHVFQNQQQGYTIFGSSVFTLSLNLILGSEP